MRKGLTLISIAALSLGLAACSNPEEAANDAALENAMVADANATAADTMPVPSPVATGQEFADAAAKSDAFEIAEAKLALEKGTAKEVKDFAAMMIKGHTDSTAKLKAAASAATPAVTPDPTLKPDQQAKLDTLGKLAGEAFDKEYGAHQVAAHTDTLATLQTYATSGDVASLKEFAAATAPVVSSHLDEAKKLPQ